MTHYGELRPTGGGDNIPLSKTRLMIGRRESCDVVLRFPNVSAHHCELELRDGYWHIRDLNSRNGIKVNGQRVTDKLVQPGDSLAVAKHNYTLHYSPADLGAIGPPPDDADMNQMFKKSLLERAGLDKGFRPPPEPRQTGPKDTRNRYDLLDDPTAGSKKPGPPA